MHEHAQPRAKPKLAVIGVPTTCRRNWGGTCTRKKSVGTIDCCFRCRHPSSYLAGPYSLDGKPVRIPRRAGSTAKLSQMLGGGGQSPVVAQAVDPFFQKKRGWRGVLKMTGTKFEPHFGLDFGPQG